MYYSLALHGTVVFSCINLLFYLYCRSCTGDDNFTAFSYAILLLIVLFSCPIMLNRRNEYEKFITILLKMKKMLKTILIVAIYNF